MIFWPRGDPDAVARDVLAGPPYRHAPLERAAPAAKSVWETLWAWFSEHVLVPIFAPIVHALVGSPASRFGGLVGIVLVALSLALIAVIVYRLAVAFVRVPGVRARAASDARALRTPPGPDVWRARARDAAAAGDFARAIAALFAAALALLDERAVVAFDAARTPGEYGRAVRRERNAAAADFDVLAGEFVRASYAAEAPSAGAYARAQTAYERFEPATRT